MRRLLNNLYDARIWLITLLSLMLFYIFLAWLAYPETFFEVFFLMVSVTFIIGSVPFFWMRRKEKAIQKALRQFLIEPDLENERVLYNLLPRVEASFVQKIGGNLREKKNQIVRQGLQVDEYETYIEEWVHEIKKPLSLLTLVLDNRADEMSPLVEQRISHARNEIQNDIEKILYFSRIRTVHRDYLFETIDLMKLCKEVVEESASLLEESEFSIAYKGTTQNVITDQKSLQFILSQIVHNSTKYAKKHSELQFEIKQDEHVILYIRDNGPGISKNDLPFLFDKGFTGGKAKATGIGLYLSRRLAEDLKIELSASSELGKGLCIALTFPKVTEEKVVEAEASK